MLVHGHNPVRALETSNMTKRELLTDTLWYNPDIHIPDEDVQMAKQVLDVPEIGRAQYNMTLKGDRRVQTYGACYEIGATPIQSPMFEDWWAVEARWELGGTVGNDLWLYPDDEIEGTILHLVEFGHTFLTDTIGVPIPKVEQREADQFAKRVRNHYK